MRRNTQPKYILLDRFLKAAFERIGHGKLTKHEGLETMVNAVSAFQAGDDAHVLPYMAGMLEAWGAN